MVLEQWTHRILESRIYQQGCTESFEELKSILLPDAVTKQNALEILSPYLYITTVIQFFFFHKKGKAQSRSTKSRTKQLFSAYLSGLGLFPFPCTSMSSSEESAGDAILVLSRRCSC